MAILVQNTGTQLRAVYQVEGLLVKPSGYFRRLDDVVPGETLVCGALAARLDVLRECSAKARTLKRSVATIVVASKTVFCIHSSSFSLPAD